MKIKRVLAVLAVVSIIIVLRFPCLDSLPVWWGDEGRWLFCARNKLLTGNWTTFGVDYCYLSPAYVGLSYVIFRLSHIAILPCRIANVFMGLATIPLIYLLARRSGYSSRVGMLAVVILGCDRLYAFLNRQVLVDTPVALFTLLSFVFLTSKVGWTRMLCCLSFAIALAFKASAFSSFLPLLVVGWFWQDSQKAPASRILNALWVVLGLALGGLVYFLLYRSNPHVFVAAWQRELRLRAIHGHVGYSPTMLVSTMKYVVVRSPALVTVPLVGLVLMLRDGLRKHIVCLSWLVGASLVIGAQSWQQTRYWIPLMPIFALVTAWTIDRIFFSQPESAKDATTRRKAAFGNAIVVLICCYSIGTFTLRYFVQKENIGDAGAQFTKWVQGNTSKESRIMGLAAYCLELDRDVIPVEYCSDLFVKPVDLKKWPADYILFEPEWRANQELVPYSKWLRTNARPVAVFNKEWEVWEVSK